MGTLSRNTLILGLVVGALALLVLASSRNQPPAIVDPFVQQSPTIVDPYAEARQVRAAVHEVQVTQQQMAELDARQKRSQAELDAMLAQPQESLATQRQRERDEARTSERD